MSTKAQRWSQKRNWSKRVFLGAYYALRRLAIINILTKRENDFIWNALLSLNVVKDNWDQSNAESKENYLKKGE